MRLYGIDEKDVVESITSYLNSVGNVAGKREIVDEKFKHKYLHPLKTAFVVEPDMIMVVTIYPLKGKRRS